MEERPPNEFEDWGKWKGKGKGGIGQFQEIEGTILD